MTKKPTLWVIRIYQIVSKVILKSIFLGGGCRFRPSCSEYTYQAVAKYGTIKGLFLGLTRILRCHSFSQGGHDPIPL